MSKVLYVVPHGADLGGIITASENYMAGFKEASHTATFITVSFSKTNRGVGGEPRGKYEREFTRGVGTGELMHPTQGWRGERRISICTPEGVKEFIKLANAHDVVVWASMFGFRNEATEGTTLWLDAIRKHKAGNVFMIHDDHMPKRYLWAASLGKYAAAFVGVQPCSLESTVGVASPRAMVYTAIPTPPGRVTPMEMRAGFMSIQVWKQWKRADALVRAVPHMPKGKVFFAGDGIALRYMRSETKCPDKFKDEKGVPIWTTAMKKAHYMGVLDETMRDAHFRASKFLVDLSVRQNSGQLNRVVQEAMAQGCVVIANPRFLTGTTPNPIFVPGRDYLPIDTNLEPRKLADVLGEYDHIDATAYAKIQRSARAKLGLFNRAHAAEDLVQLGLGKIAGAACYPAEPDKDMIKRATEEFVAIFGAKP